MVISVRPYPIYSHFHHLPSDELVFTKNGVLRALFPNNMDQGVQLSTLLLTSSVGRHMLLLADAFSFVDFRNVDDPLSEICPVSGDYAPRICSIELQQAVRTHGKAIAGSPPLIALEITLDTRDGFSKFFHAGYTGANPQAELVRLISRQVTEVYIGNYHIKQVEDSWQPPTGQPEWRGVAFEQSDRVMRAWFHEPNPQALKSAQEEVVTLITETESKQKSIQAEIQLQTEKRLYSGLIKEKLDWDLTKINQLLQEQKNKLSYLTAQMANSTAHTTFQCALTMQVDQKDKIHLLNQFVCQQIAHIMDDILQKVSWVELGISRMTIEHLIGYKFKLLKQKMTRLATYDTGNGTVEDMLKKESWIQETYGEFCQKKANLAPAEETKEWQNELSKKLRWLIDSLRNSDCELKRLQDRTVDAINIPILDIAYIIKFLRKGDDIHYSLGLELAELDRERTFLDTVLFNVLSNSRRVHLVKRITTSGNMYFSVTQSPDDPADRPDPNKDLNEVHIPVVHIQNTMRQIMLSQSLPPRSLIHRWIWRMAGVGVLMGAWWIHHSLQQKMGD